MGSVQCVPGRKAPGDKRVLVDGVALTYEMWLEAGWQLYDNEERIFPVERGYLGGKMLVNTFMWGVRDPNHRAEIANTLRCQIERARRITPWR